jgi:serine/threonine protein kinase
MPETMAQPRTKQIASFELLERLGHGGMAVVFRARRFGRGEICAVKIVSRRLAEDPEVSIRFRHECEFACTFDHPNLVRALEYGRSDGMPYLVMEYVSGQSLAKLMVDGPLPEERAVSIITQVAEALTYLHERKIVHRDIKPENVLVSSEGTAKLFDFGLLKDLEASLGVTKSGTGMGTLEYTAPEQYEDARNVDPRSDVYSLACTLYAALTGAYPFGSGGHVRVLKRKLDNDFEPPRDRVPTLSQPVNDAICRALSARRELRPIACAEFIAQLKGERSLGPVPEECRGQSRRPIPGMERRATVRHEVDLESSCEVMLPTEPGNWPATVRDVSVTGLCLRSRRRFDVATTLRVTLNSLVELSSYTARVCWVRETDGRRWLHGCAFDPPLTSKELEAICFEGSSKTRLARARA